MCHIGGKFGILDLVLGSDTWERDPVRLTVDCARCHNKAGDELTAPTNDKCMSCHSKEVAKRAYDTSRDVHMVDNGMLCQDCHFRFTDGDSDHQFAKGTVLDTSNQTQKNSMDGGCSAAALGGTPCHGPTPHTHPVFGGTLNTLHTKVACETCHTGLRKGGLALKSRTWQDGTPVNAKRGTDWVPFHKWYDGSGSSTDWPASGHLPILGPAEMKGNPGAKIYPFNNISVTWWLKNTGNPAEPPLDDIIPNSVAKAATAFFMHPPSQAEMRTYDGDGTPGADYPDALLFTGTASFNVSHSVEASFYCSDCHGWSNYVMEWADLGYAGDKAPSMGAIVSHLSTTACYPSDKIKIKGSMFGDSLEDFADPREITAVKLNVLNSTGPDTQMPLKVITWTDTMIKVKIPSEAKLLKKFGALPLTRKVYIKNGAHKSIKKKFTIKAP